MREHTDGHFIKRIGDKGGAPYEFSLLQGMTISTVARWLKLDLPLQREGNEFGVEIPEEIDTQLRDVTLSAEDLLGGNRLADMNLPAGTLVMLVKRGNEFMIPNGSLELHVGDKLLVISENRQQQIENDKSRLS